MDDLQKIHVTSVIRTFHAGHHDDQYFEDVLPDQNTQAFTFGRMLAE